MSISKRKKDSKSLLEKDRERKWRVKQKFNWTSFWQDMVFLSFSFSILYFSLSISLFLSLLLSLHLSLFLLFHFLPTYSITENQLHSIKFFLFSLHQILSPLFFLHSFMATTEEPSSWKKKNGKWTKKLRKTDINNKCSKILSFKLSFWKIFKTHYNMFHLCN